MISFISKRKERRLKAYLEKKANLDVVEKRMIDIQREIYRARTNKSGNGILLSLETKLEWLRSERNHLKLELKRSGVTMKEPDLLEARDESPQHARKLLDRFEIADVLLLFACASPDDAEITVGDLMENFAKVAARSSATVANLWFGWELSLLVLTKARQRLVKSFFGPLLDRWFKSAGS